MRSALPSTSVGRGPYWPAHQGPGGDLNPQTDGSLTLEQLERFFHDLWYEPAWRAEAEIDTAYYDGDQYTQDSLAKAKQHGIMLATVNLAAPAIDAIAGLETISRQGMRCVSHDDDSYEMAQAINTKWQEAARETRFHQRIGEAFKKAITMGLSWIEVNRQSDPFKYPYRAGNPPWREMFVDYRSREMDYSDSRFYIRRRWMDEDDALKHFNDPKMKSIIQSASQHVGFYGDDWISRFETGFTDFSASLRSPSGPLPNGSEPRWNLEEDEWMNNLRGRVGIIECLYHVPIVVEVLKLRTGQVIQLDRNSTLHLQLLQTGEAQYGRGPTKVWRQGFYVGPEKLIDRPLATNMPHYIPMVCYRKDSNGAPYGIMRRMRSPQENINARYTRILYDQQTRKFFIDESAVDNPKETARELNKATSFITLKDERRTDAGIREQPGVETTAFTFQMLMEAKANMYDVTGLHPEFYGQVQSAGQSGVAIDQLIEQSSRVLGPALDHYREAKLKAGQLLFQLVMIDLADMMDAAVEVQDELTGQHKKIYLNARASDGTLNNDLMMARLEIQLETAPSSETYRQQKFQSLVELIKSMPEDMQGVMMDLVVRAANLPNQEEMLERIRSLTGFGPEPKDPQKREELQQQAEEQSALQERMQELEFAIQEAEASLTQSKAIAEQVRANKLAGADTDLTEAKTLTELAKAEAVQQEQRRKAIEAEANLLGAAARLRKEKNSGEKPPQKGLSQVASKKKTRKKNAKKTPITPLTSELWVFSNSKNG